MTPPQIRYTPENHDDNGKNKHLKLYQCCICLSKMVIFHLHLGLLEGNQFPFKTSNKNLQPWPNNWLTYLKNPSKMTCFCGSATNLKEAFQSLLVSPVTHKVSCLNYLLQGNKNTTNRITTSLVDNPFVVFTNSQHLPLPLRSTPGHLYGCKAKVGPWISTAFGQSHGQLRMCSRGFGDHRGTWRFLVGGLKVWKKTNGVSLLFTWYDLGGARVFPTESRFLVYVYMILGHKSMLSEVLGCL